MSTSVIPHSLRVPNISHYLTRNAARYPKEIAIVQGSSQWTWQDLDQRVNALCNGLAQEFSVAKGDRVCVQLPNSPAMLEIMLAAFRLGAVWVPSNFRNGPDELAYQCEKAAPKVLLVDHEYAQHVERCKKSVKQIIEGGGSDDAYEAMIARHRGIHHENVSVERDDPCWLFFTSGSTGRPKASVLTQGQMAFTILNHLNDLMPGTTSEDASLVVAPLSHGSGMHQICQIAAGAKSVILPPGRFDPAMAWQLVQEWKVTNLFTVPTIVKLLVSHPSVHEFDHSSLRYLVYAGSPMYRQDQKTALETLGNVLVQYYGLGEVTGAITVLKPQDHEHGATELRSGTCGQERTGIEVSIQDDHGQILSAGQTGEICVVGPAVFPGYLEDETANEKSFRAGWFRTGDMGHLDPQRFLYITGRASDMYISGGSNVYPREVEEILLEHPSLKEVAIIGIEHPKWGEVGLAVCVLNDAYPVEEGDLSRHIEQRVAKYKLPHRYLFVDSLPKSNVGKVTKKLLRESLTQAGKIPVFTESV